jgi:hypothetical protein
MSGTIFSCSKLQVLKYSIVFVKPYPKCSGGQRCFDRFFVEPVGSVKPKFPTMDKSHAFESLQGNSVTLLCPAQAYPVPSIRY